MKKLIALVLAMSMVLSLCACGKNDDSREKDLLCRGVWVIRSSYNNAIMTDVYDFNANGTLKMTMYHYSTVFQDKSEYSAKYSIDTGKKQIKVKWDDGEKQTFSYFLNEADGTMIFISKDYENLSSLKGLDYIW